MISEKEIQWFTDNRPTYDKLGYKIVSILEQLILDKSIIIHDIGHRAKSVESYRRKILKGNYSDPKTQITDLAGIRVIAFIESDVYKVNQLIEANFDIDEDNSLNKSDSLGIDKVGYKSMHYIASLDKERAKLPEYSKFKKIKFEIQVRTILQHAWAEIEHDRSYKFSGTLPEHIARKFKILSGTLELIDNQFEELSRQIDLYSTEVEREIKSSNYEGNLDSISLKIFLNLKLDSENIVDGDGEFDIVFNELEKFGVTNLYDLDKLIPNDFTINIQKLKYKSSIIGYLRDFMMISDPKKYFKNSWNDGRQYIDPQNSDLIGIYQDEIKKIFDKYGILVESYL